MEGREKRSGGGGEKRRDRERKRDVAGRKEGKWRGGKKRSGKEGTR